MPRTKQNTPSSRPNLQRHSDAMHALTDRRLKRLGQTWSWLATAIADNGIASPASIMHWGNRRNLQVGCGVYSAVDEILRTAERRARRPIKLGGLP